MFGVIKTLSSGVFCSVSVMECKQTRYSILSPCLPMCPDVSPPILHITPGNKCRPGRKFRLPPALFVFVATPAQPSPAVAMLLCVTMPRTIVQCQQLRSRVKYYLLGLNVSGASVPLSSLAGHWPCLDAPPGELAVSVVDKLGLLLGQRVDAVAERQQRPAEWPIRDEHCGHVTSCPPITAHLLMWAPSFRRMPAFWRDASC